MISPASERSELAGAEERWHQPTVFRFGWRVCGRRSRTLSRRPGDLRCGPPAGLLGSGEDASVRAHLPLSDHPECVADCGAGFKEALAVGCVMCGLTGALLPDVRRWSGGRRTHHTSGPKESLLTACRVQSRMSMGSAALLSGTDLLRLGEVFSGSAGDSELHRICVAGGQAVSGGMLAMRRALERQRRSRCAPVIGRGRRRWPQTPQELAESHHKGWRLAGTPLSPLGKWRRWYGDKEASVRIHFPKGGGGRYLT